MSVMVTDTRRLDKDVQTITSLVASTCVNGDGNGSGRVLEPLENGLGNKGIEERALFDACLLDETICKSLPEGYTMRPLNRSDYGRGYMDCLAQLTKTGNVSKEDFEERFDALYRHRDVYMSIVIEEDATNRVVASGTILVEYKFIRGCGKVGHIEDIVVHESQRGKNYGKRIIDQLTHLGKHAGCYKIILCCDEKNIGFYERCGYEKKEVEMVKYF